MKTSARDHLGKGASSRAPTIDGACGNASAHRYNRPYSVCYQGSGGQSQAFPGPYLMR